MEKLLYMPHTFFVNDHKQTYPELTHDIPVEGEEKVFPLFCLVHPSDISLPLSSWDPAQELSALHGIQGSGGGFASATYACSLEPLSRGTTFISVHLRLTCGMSTYDSNVDAGVASGVRAPSC